jgi:release factor glutamine methyltransferase
MTLREALTRATRQLDASPDLRADAARDALLLLMHTLGISRATLLADPGRALTPGQQAVYDALVLRRLGNEPIQYITGEQEFYGLALHVTPAVLIPRSETEQLVEAVLAELDASQPLRILDVGTGSGAIAIALAHHLPHAAITAVDLSAAALEVAASNAARHNLTGRIRFLASDLLDALAPDEACFDAPGSPASALGSLGWDAIVSNPPYVPIADRDALHPQVRDHEPAAALFAGLDGLNLYRRLIPQARAALQPNGLLALEIGHNRREAIAALLADWNQLRFLDDLQHIPRIALARRP